MTAPVFEITDLPANMQSKIVLAGECWNWTGALNSRGYGSVSSGKSTSKLAHRRAWEVANGEIPEGLTIDHLCRNKQCVNTAHMEVVSRAENSHRGNAARTHCKRGHDLNNGDVHVQKRLNGFTYRVCRQCVRDRRMEAIA